MTIFRLNFLLKVAHILVCQNPSFISTDVRSETCAVDSLFDIRGLFVLSGTPVKCASSELKPFSFVAAAASFVKDSKLR